LLRVRMRRPVCPHFQAARFFGLSISMRNTLLHFWQVTISKQPTFKKMTSEKTGSIGVATVVS